MTGERAGALRVPLYCGDRESAAFGWYHQPRPPAEGSLAAIICPPLGYEYTHSHRALRHLADALAVRGIPAMRFDYHGTGDSPGTDEDPTRVAAWLQSIKDAARALKAESGRPRIALIGLRMGATLAVAASTNLDAAGLVLWAPCVRGRTYVREIKAVSRTGSTASDPPPGSADLEAGGFVMTPETQSEIGRLSLDDRAPATGRVLIVGRDDASDATAALQSKWAAQGIDVEHRRLPGYADMVVAPHNTKVPHAAIAEITDWISTLDASFGDAIGSRRSTTADRQAGASARQECSIGDVRERCFWFGADRHLFGILSEPRDHVRREAPAIVLPNAGSTHHVGPGRLYVALARALSHAGFRCLRFDFTGLGDSVTVDPARENVPYPPDASAMVASAMDALADETGAGTFVVMGLCSGAHTAFHAAVDLPDYPIVESVLINPLTFYYTPGMPLDESQSAHVTQWQRYMRSVGSLDGWSKLFRDDTHISTIVADVFERIRIVSRNKVEELRARHDPEATDRTQLEADIRAIGALGRRLTFVFSRFDPGYDLLMIGAGRLVKPLRKRGAITLWRIKGANHTFDAPGPRREMIRTLTAFLASRYLDGLGRQPGINSSQACPPSSSLPWTAA